MCERMAAMPNTPTHDVNAGAPHYVEIELSVPEHEALLKFQYVDPMQRAQLEAATRDGQTSVRVKMERYLVEMLAGDLAYVINRAKLTPSMMLLNEAAEAIELALRSSGL